MNLTQVDDLHATAFSLFQTSSDIFWHALPVTVSLGYSEEF
jgi:hypothetical protein